jgi:alpha-L-fucosidase
MYFDGGNGQPAYRASMTEFTAFYDNFAVSHHIDGVITLKDYAMEWTAGARDFERSLRTDIDPRPWQTDTSISNLSWGYMEHDQFKTPEFLVHQLVLDSAEFVPSVRQPSVLNRNEYRCVCRCSGFF